MKPVLVDDDDPGPSWLSNMLARQGSLDLSNSSFARSIDISAIENSFVSQAVSPSFAVKSTDDSKARFNKHIRDFKSAKNNKDLDGMISALQKALLERPANEKVRDKLQKLKDKKSKETVKALRDLMAGEPSEAGKQEEVSNNMVEDEIVDGWRHRPGSSSYDLDGGKFRLPSSVFQKLFQHQRQGVKWMYSLHQHKSEEHPTTGGVLADDMGLGKTVQVAAFLRGLFASRLAETALVVAPKSVMENWRSELLGWTKRQVVVYDGTAKQRERALQAVSEHGGIMLVTYGMVLRNVHHLERLRNPSTGESESWDYVILDEGHKIKNSSTESTKSIKCLEASHKLVLTGTPILNHLMELWALYDFAKPGLLGNKASFRSNFDEAIVKASHRNAKPEQKLLGETMLWELKSLIQPYFLRRVKDEVFSTKKDTAETDEPKKEDPMAKHRLTVRKNDFIVWVSLSKVQLEIYDRFLTMPEVKEILNSSKSPLAAITVLKKICLHPSLLHSDMKTLRESAGNSATVVDMLQRMQDEADMIGLSGKLSFMVKLLDELLAKRHRVLIFSQWKTMLDIIGKVLNDRGCNYFRIDGNVTKTEDRQKLVETFNANAPGTPPVFLLTTQAGGLGLTLTGADRAIIFDPSWNLVDDQAVDRIYRIGQKRNCVVYRLITCGTVEEKIYRKQVFKGGLSRTVSNMDDTSGLNGTDFGFRYFTKEELRALFTLENPYESWTQKQLEEKHSQYRVTDEDLDHHLKFLSTIDNFHGVSDHDLLFHGGVQPKQAEPVALEEDVEPLDFDSILSKKLDELELHDRSIVVDEDEQIEKENVVDDDDVVLLDSDDVGLVEPMQELSLQVRGLTIGSPSPAKAPSKGPEIKYVGPPSTKKKEKKKPSKVQSKAEKYNKLVTEARSLEDRGDMVKALDKYMDAFELDDSQPLLQQKILFLRRSLEPKKEEDDDDVKIFDDEEVPAEKPVVAPPAPSSNECVICCDQSKEAVFIPCGHVACCLECANNVKSRDSTCPMCRGHVAGVFKVFL